MLAGRCSAFVGAALSFGVVVSLFAAPAARADEPGLVSGNVFLGREVVKEAEVMLIRLRDNKVVDRARTDEHGNFTLKTEDLQTYRVLAVSRGEPHWSWTHKRFIPSEKGTRLTLNLGPMEFSTSDPQSVPERAWECTRIMTFMVFGTWVSQWECTDTCGEETLSWSEWTEWET